MAGVAGRSGTNKGKDKPFRDALRMQLAAAGDNQKALRAIADALIASAMAGDMQAIKEIGDRLDGKPAQAIVGEDGEGNAGPLVVTWLPIQS
jgi:hypothetical protein